MFSGGRKQLQNLTHPRCPNIKVIGKLILEDRQFLVREMDALSDISVDSVETILQTDLKFRELDPRPRLLNADQQATRCEIYQRRLDFCNEKGDDFFNRILISGEFWEHHYTRESKYSSMNWRFLNEDGLVKFKT